MGSLNGHMFTVVFSGQAISASQDLFEITAAAGKPLVIHSIVMGNSSDFGDAQEEGLRWAIKSGQSSGGSGGITYTPQPTVPGDTASFTAKTNNTVKASGGSISNRHADTFNIRAGLQYRPTPEERITIAGGARGTVELFSTPNDSITFDATMYVEEIG